MQCVPGDDERWQVLASYWLFLIRLLLLPTGQATLPFLALLDARLGVADAATGITFVAAWRRDIVSLAITRVRLLFMGILMPDIPIIPTKRVLPG